MMPKHHSTFLIPASLPLVPPPNVNAMTVCARSRAISCRGLQRNSHTISTTISIRKIVPKEGVPKVPCRMSVKLKPEVPTEEGGTNVNVAKRRWIMERNVGGICRRTIRMARVSHNGQDRRTVSAKEKGSRWFAADFFAEVTSIWRWFS